MFQVGKMYLLRSPAFKEKPKGKPTHFGGPNPKTQRFRCSAAHVSGCLAGWSAPCLRPPVNIPNGWCTENPQNATIGFDRHSHLLAAQLGLVSSRWSVREIANESLDFHLSGDGMECLAGPKLGQFKSLQVPLVLLTPHRDHKKSG